MSNSAPKNGPWSNVDNLGLSDTLGIQFSGGSADPTDANLAAGRLYYSSATSVLKIFNGSSWTSLGSGGGGGTPSWEAIYLNDSTFGITSGTWTITQSSANPIITFNKTNVGAGSVLDITNAGTGADISNSTNYSLKASGGHGVLELGSTGSINVTDGALSVGKTGTATTLLGTLTVAEAVTFTSGGVTVTSGSVTLSSGNLVLTSGNFTVSAGQSSLVSSSNAASSLLITNNTVSTYGVGGVSTGMVLIRSTSLTSGTALRVQLTEATLSGGFYFDAFDVTAGAAVFSVGEDGAVVIAGPGAASPSLTLTTGDLTLSDGNVAITSSSTTDVVSITDNSLLANNALIVKGSGAFTGVTSSSFVAITPTGLTTGTALYVAGAAATTLSTLVDFTSSTTTGIVLRLVASGTQTGVGQILSMASAGTTTTTGLVSLTANSQTTGSSMIVSSTSIAKTSGSFVSVTHTSSGTLAARSGATLDATTSMTHTADTDVTQAFSDLVIARTVVRNTGGADTHTTLSQGALLALSNTITATTGTITDTMNGISVTMSAGGTGDGILVTHNAVTGKAIDVVSSGTTAAGVVLVTANSLTSGQMLKLATSATAITTTGRIFLSSHTGATGSTAVLNEFISAANDETIILQITGSDVLAAGVGLKVSLAAMTTGTAIAVSNLTALTTGKGLHVASSTAQTDGILIHVASSSTALTSTGRLLLVDHTGNAAVSSVIAEIKSAAADETVVLQVLASAALAAGKALNVSVAAMTTGTAISVADANALTTGSMLSLVSNSSDATARNLAFIHNDHASAVGAVALALRSDAVISTNFRKMRTESNGSQTCTFWLSDGSTSPNTALTGSAGDICYNGDSGKAYYCTGTTNWTALA